MPFKLTEQEKQALKEADRGGPFKSFQKEMVVYVVLLILAIILFWQHYSILTLIVVVMAGVISIRYGTSLRASKATLSVANKVEAELKKQQKSALKFRPKVFLFVVLPLILLLVGVLVYVLYLPTYKEREEMIYGVDVINMPEQSQDETTDWQTYRNEESGFEVKYPQGWYVYSSNVSNIKIISFQNQSNEVAVDANKSSFFRCDLRIINEPVESWLARQSLLCDSFGTECYSERTKIGENEGYFIKGGQKQEDGSDGFARVLFYGDTTYLVETLWPKECSFWNQPQKCEIFNQVLSTFRFIEAKDSQQETPNVTSCPPTEIIAPDGWKPYQNEKFTFEFQYPKDWVVVEHKSMGAPYLAYVEFGPKDTIQEGGSSAVDVRNQNIEEFMADLQKEFIIEGNLPVCFGNKIATKYHIQSLGAMKAEREIVIARQGDTLINFYLGEGQGNNEIIDQIFSTFKFLE
ncbi:MAG: hypothetical protein Q8N55_00830 [bacterium]|nr:hypothetical protein [bacterium]